MTLLAVERIKLLSTRSPWWCAIITLALTIGFTAMVAGSASSVTLQLALASQKFGLMVVMVMGALAVTTEYRFGTIRTTFQAIPNRTAVLVAKAVLVGLIALVLGEITAFGSLGTAAVLSPDPELALSGPEQWRQVAGIGPMYALSAVLAVAIGILVRHTAGAVSVVLLWPLLAESMIALIPGFGQKVYAWLPFVMADKFLTGTEEVSGRVPAHMPLGPWAALAYFAAVSVGMLVVALRVANRRDA